MRELSNFSSGLKQSVGVVGLNLKDLQKNDPSLFGKKTENLINAKAGKNRSRKASNEGLKLQEKLEQLPE